jgi:hypothetical protein
MSRSSSYEEFEPLNQTNEATLAALTLQISTFVHAGTLDSRCAAKLIKRLRKEADHILESGDSTQAGRDELQSAFATCDVALRDHDARLLVAAHAALRGAEDLPQSSV